MLNARTSFRVGIFVLTLLLPAYPAFSGSGSGSDKVTQLVVIDSKVGEGKKAVADAENGDLVEVQYTGWLYDPDAPDHKGKKFDSSADHGAPFLFNVGAGRVIKGWDQGVNGMKVGGKRTLIIPSDLAYGPNGAGRGLIPPNAALIFEIDLLNIR